jgi:hypothetical protein
MKVTKAIKKIFLVAVGVLSLNSFADVNLNNFEFKGYKFGVKAPSKSNLPPWEMSYEELRNYSLDRPYKRIKEYREARVDFLQFGDSKLFSIRYKYFDNRLYRIEVDFVKQSDCRHAREANELIQLKYGLKTEADIKTNFDDYISSFSNEKVSIFINCSMSLLDSIGNKETTEKQTAIVFEDVATAKRTQDYMRQEDDASFKKSQRLKEDKLRQKINF